ncbi:hypothetical protein PRZ48_012708 [Zasmidium cellare]|uniref:Uncharacterized protein n=1 Tax=Zasmidium cellare TaxID=395010 RepID=A0ABR0E5S8_ZASCE|nr:hypothetical protein PRZ48_012708 [Zasmidium cellare]
MPSKRVILAGLGHFFKSDPTPGSAFGTDFKVTQLQMLEDDMEKARAFGYDTSALDLDPDDIEGSMKRLQAELKRQKCDVLLIGFGLRGNKDFTELFERAVNAGFEADPTIKFGFTRSPDDVLNTARRVLEV